MRTAWKVGAFAGVFATAWFIGVYVREPGPLASTKYDAVIDDALLFGSSGEIVRLSTIVGLGTETLVAVFSTSCSSCIEDLRTLADLRERYAGRLQVIPIAVTPDRQFTLKAAQAVGQRLTFFRGEGTIAQRLGLSIPPALVLLNRWRHVVFASRGGTAVVEMKQFLETHSPQSR